MNNSKWKLKTLIALTALTVVAVPVCLQKKSANAASKYTYKKGFTYETSYLIFDMFRCFIMGLMEK